VVRTARAKTPTKAFVFEPDTKTPVQSEHSDYDTGDFFKLGKNVA
jgi:hypothetical protein